MSITSSRTQPSIARRVVAPALGRDLPPVGPDEAVRVICGSVHVFIRREVDGNLGTRMFLVSLQAGDVFLGLPPDDIPTGFGLTMRASSPEARLIVFAAGDDPAAVRSGLGWLGRALHQVGVNDAEPLGVGANHLKPDRVATPAVPLVAVACDGDLHLGRSLHRGSPAVRAPLVLPVGAAVETPQEQTVTCVELGPEIPVETLVVAAHHTVGHIVAWAAAERIHRTELLDERAHERTREDAQAVDRAVAALADVVPGVSAAAAAGRTSSPLALALERLCQLGGIDPALSGGPVDKLRPFDRLREGIPEQPTRALDALELPYRRVRLRGDWWRYDGGALLAFRRENGRDLGQAGDPVVLQVRNGRYALWDPRTGRRSQVDEAAAHGLSETGYVVYRTLDRQITSLRQLFRFGWRDLRGDAVETLVAAFIVGMLGMVTPIVSATVFNTVVPTGDLPALAIVLGFLLGAAMAQTAFSLVRAFCSVRLAARVQLSLQPPVWHRVFDLPASLFRSRSTGGLVTAALGIQTVQQLVGWSTLSSVLTFVFSMTSLVLLFVYSAQLALYALLLVILTGLVLAWLSKRQLRHERRMWRQQGPLYETTHQFLSHIDVLRSTGAERRAFARWAAKFAEQRRAIIGSARIQAATSAVTAGFPVAASLLIVATVGTVLAGEVSVGSFAAFSAALGQFGTAMVVFSWSLAKLVRSIPSIEDLRPLLEAEPESATSGQRRPRLDGSIQLNHVSFAYEPGLPVLEDLTLEIRPGEFVGVVGPSGAGKSTVLRLLLGFEQPQTGSILFDGVPMQSIDIHHLRKQISVVLQDIHPMSGTIADNISSGDSGSADIWRAVRMAGLEDLVRSLPMGLATNIDDEGTSFSGGQLQRLLIARALARPARIFLFDEATSALDNVTQAHVMTALEQLRVTRIVVAQRLSTIMHADRIVYIDDGRVAESGTFEELIAAGARFAEHMQRQQLKSGPIPEQQAAVE